MIERIGKYQILEQLNRGALGTLFKAQDQVLRRDVALKVVSDEFELTAELRDRFFREAQACAKLRHPNIITLYDLAEAEGRLFIVMELLQGEALHHVIAERQVLPLEQQLSLMMQVCDGLHYAHQQGVVHRDVRPNNLFVLRDGHVKILDFSLAGLTVGESGYTRRNALTGGLRYVAPERLRGEGDYRVDIFSAGAVFYELLSHRPAVAGDDAMQVLENLRNVDPVPLAQVAPTVPAEVCTIIDVMLRRDPAERQTDLRTVGAQLARIRGGLVDEAQRVRGHVRTQLSALTTLEEALAIELGRTLPIEPVLLPGTDDTLAATQAQEAWCLERLRQLQALQDRATSLAPAVQRGRQSLAEGKLEDAVAELGAVVQEMPEHLRARAWLEEARRRAEELRPQPAVSPTPAMPPQNLLNLDRPEGARDSEATRPGLTVQEGAAGPARQGAIEPLQGPVDRDKTTALAGLDSVPTVERPRPALENPAPTRDELAPAVETPAPAVVTPVPTVEAPARVVEKPTVVEKPAGLTREVASTESGPARASTGLPRAKTATFDAPAKDVREASPVRRAPSKRRRTIVVAAVALGLFLLLGLGAEGWRRRQSFTDHIAQVEAARSTVVALRDRAVTAGAPAFTAKLFDEASARDQEGRRLASEGRTADALSAFQDAGTRYVEAARRAGEVGAERGKAERARADMLAARSPRLRDDAPSAAEAGTLERQADGALGRLAFAEAANGYRVAAEAYTRAATQSELMDLLDKYTRAFDARNADAIREIRCAISPEELRRHSLIFGSVKQYQLRFTMKALRSDGDAAEARGRREDVVVLPTGQTVRTPSESVVSFTRKEGRWCIARVS